MDVSSNSMQRIRNLQANANLGADALVLISEVTATNGADIEDPFDHYLPTAYFLRDQATLLPRVDLASLERAETLFRRVNDLLPRA